MGKCTILSIFGIKDWWDARFDHLCREHDDAYKTFCIIKKTKADFCYFTGMCKMRHRYIPLACLTLPVLLTLGTVYWLYKRTLDAIRGGL